MSVQAERLYYSDSYLKEFVSIVIDVKEDEGDTWVRLRESAFYPTSGGQPYDTGVLFIEGGSEAVRVTEVQVEEGQVWHRLAGSLSVGQAVTGRIDWSRRFDFMQQHCGQHILSACFEQALGAKTSSFHMGDTYSSIDLDKDLTDDAVLLVMRRANEWIWRDVPVRARFVTEDELSTMKLRKAPSVKEDIRIVTIEGLEDNACGGTHPASTGQVGQILITRTERMHGGTRVVFVCGGRALSTAKQAIDTLRGLANGLSVGPDDVPLAVTSLQEQFKESKRKYEAIRGQYSGLLARDYVNTQLQTIDSTCVLVAEIPDLDEVHELKRLASSSVTWIADAHPNAPYIVVFVGGWMGRAHVVIQAAENAPVAANQLIQAALPPLNGKGGGTAVAAQGSAPVAVKEAADSLASCLRANLPSFSRELH
jgi:alanyl-tRNA synthetase